MLLLMVKLPILFLVSLSSLWLDASVSTHNPFYCYSDDPIRPQNGMFGSFAAYETNRVRNVNASTSQCEPTKFWMMSRHGTRLPTRTELQRIFEHSERIHRDILRNYDAGRTSLCAADLALIRGWNFDPNITLDMEQYLTVSGWNEFQNLAQRLQQAFPTLLPSTYTASDYFFRSTLTQRATTSVRAFADGLFGFNGNEKIEFEEVPEQDFLLTPFNHCPLFQEAIQENVEYEAFRDGPEYQEMLTQVSTKLGFHGANHLRSDEVVMLSEICKYEQTWDRNSTSPICAAFSVANHRVLEYADDLYYYSRYGYGLPDYRTLFENVQCDLLQNLLQFIQSTDASDHKARILAGHLQNMQLLLVALRVFEDESPMNRHNFAQQIFRLWKTGVVTPLAANLAVVRYE